MILDITILISLFASLMLFGTFVISFSNPVYSLLSLVLVFLIGSGILLDYGLDFIGFSLIIVYVGAIATLFLFIIMMLDIKIQRQTGEFNQSLPVFLILIFFFFLHLSHVYSKSFSQHFLLKMDKPVSFSWDMTIDQTLSTIESLGLCLYTNYLIAFLLAGILLLIALTGSIVLTRKNLTEAASQDLHDQLATTTLKYTH